MSRFIRAVLLAVGLLVQAAVWADESGRIVGVLDGDTVDLLTGTKTLIRVRLSGIDAPEKNQAYGNVAKKALSDMAFNRDAVVQGSKKDRYGRLVGKITVAGADVNLWMVRLGLAWHYKKYEREQTVEDRQRYADAEMQAHAKHVGLWADTEPVPPWEFRSERKSRAKESRRQ